MSKTIRIGKSPENDYVINNPTVSRTHAMLVVADDQRHAVLRDLGSTNGTYVNEKRITTDTTIDVNTPLRFGNAKLTLSDILQRTRITPIEKGSSNTRLIGRGEECQIKMKHDDVSNRHAILRKLDDGTIVIEDCNSTNGTYVNGERITSRKLRRGDHVTITRNHALDWENVFPGSKPRKTSKGVNWKPFAIAGIAAGLLVLAGLAIHLLQNRTWDNERIYKQYHDAVCWVYVKYGYKVSVDGEDFTPILCKLCNLTPSQLVHIKKDKLVPGSTAHQGTAFFISKDGKLATNLHITRPWLFTDDIEQLETLVNKILALYATQNPLLNRSKVKVEGVTEGMYIILDGLPISDGNAIEVTEVNGYDDINKDVAIIQTTTRELPSRVKNIIDIMNADTSEESLTVGRAVYTIGYPYGVEIAMNSNQELKNQVHAGTITQNRGDYEFGHDAETAGGASGSPILNDHGRLVGIHHAGMTGVTGAQGFNWGIKAKYIIDLLK